MSGNSKEKVMFFREEFADGEGTFKYPNKSKYEGQWKNGQKDGFGVHTLSDRSKYIGQHKNGLRHGKGIESGAEEKWICDMCEREQSPKKKQHIFLQHGILCSSCFDKAI